ncbi:MAG: hypothetical protein ACP5SP_06610 [Caldisericum sp.]|uniref:hypothetical protein n=1 Tax=Caldisericum sp. TaxID=2499687 RepID=UPI003D139112
MKEKVMKEKVICAIKETLENEKDVDLIAKEELTYYMDFVVEFLEGGESILKKPLRF